MSMDLQELFRSCYDLKRHREADPNYDPNVIEFLLYGTPEEREAVQVKMDDLFKKYLASQPVSGDSHPTTDECDR